MAADFLELYGVDVVDALDRPWPWFRARVYGIMDTPPGKLVVPTDKGSEIRLVWRTRLQHIAYDEKGGPAGGIRSGPGQPPR